MSERVKIAIVGSGPAGLSAAARAAALDREGGAATPSYVVLEGFSAHAKTMQQYQRGKHVMAEPGFLSLRSDLPFGPGTRESILDGWSQGITGQGLNVRYDAEVRAISGQKGDFSITVSDGSTVQAENVVLAIGMAGNPRKLGVPGEDLPQVQYTLDDPGVIEGEVIVVVGAGDAAIENALALAKQNRVHIVNRRDEFSRAKDANLNAVLTAISNPKLSFDCFYSSNPKEVRANPDAGHAISILLETKDGVEAVACDRVIARLGGVPPRAFVESAGVSFPSTKADAIPELSGQYESNVPGLYIVGSLGGFPLIKQAMNQGYDVVEYIHGNAIKPADHPLLEYQFHVLPYRVEVDKALERFQQRIPMFGQFTALQFRELVIESNILVSYPAGELLQEAQAKLEALTADLAQADTQPRLPRLIEEGDAIFRQGEFGTSCFMLVDGEVNLHGSGGQSSLERGDLFGENSLISGRPREADALAGNGCVVIEIPRRIMVKLMNSNDLIKSYVDRLFIARELRRHFAPNLPVRELIAHADATTVHDYRAGDVIFSEGEPAESLHLLRLGSAVLSRDSRGAEIVLRELRGGQQIGQMALMGDRTRRETARATVATETVEVSRETFLALVGQSGEHVEALQSNASAAVKDNALMEARPESSAMMDFLMDQGLGEATDALVINETLCVGCDNCEVACAETHGGLSRLKRSAGKSFAGIHVPISCRHCEHPHCMKDCPPNAINRAPSGEVFIDAETCIGCGNCETNCPYDVIKMSYDAPTKPGLLSWLFFGLGSGPGEPDNLEGGADQAKKAVKCDACVGRPSGPACVQACPTGAALRVNPEQYIELMES